MKTSRLAVLAAATLALGWTVPALADLDRGYAAWDRGDFSTAVREWRDLAASGNPDAQYNMAQAYRLGRGVEKNEAQAEILLAKAAAQGHIRAIDTYGLMLFQSGRREEAMPYVISSAERGNPRAQYLLGIGHFNGDLVGKDWVRAYALMTLSNTAGFEPAKAGITQMDDFIPLDQRQQAQVLARTLKQQADTNLNTQLAASDLSVGANLAGNAPPPKQASTSPLPSRANRIPQPIPQTKVPPSVAAAQTAIAEATRVTGTESPASAGADFARNGAPASSQPTSTPAASPASARIAQAPRPAPQPASTGNGPWRVQLGAFSVRANADRLWSRVAGKAELSGKEKLLVTAGRVVKLQAGGFPSQSSAQNACNALKRGGQDCLVTK